MTDEAAQQTWHATLSYYRHKKDYRNQQQLQQLECRLTYASLLGSVPCFALLPRASCRSRRVDEPTLARSQRRRLTPHRG